jgi:predicted dehydrogenase
MRIGVLGAARIAPAALLRPARVVDGVEVGAVAARDRGRASAFAAKHGVATVHDSYADLLADPSLDAVYVPLPNGRHAEWTLAAIAAGKHVLCEKPFTANAEQARQVAAAAEGAGVVVMEAFHYRYHPLAQRMVDIVRSGELGRIRRVDRAMTAEFSLADGGTGHIHASMWSSAVLRIRARVVGDLGSLTVTNFVGPHMGARFVVSAGGVRRRIRFDREVTYVCQLRAFAAAVGGQSTNLTPPVDSVATMGLIDDIYAAAGLPVRA